MINLSNREWKIFLLIGINLLLWNIFIPIFELPSEQLYFTRIQSIATSKQLPDLRQFENEELAYPDTYPVLMTPVINLLTPPYVYDSKTKKFNSSVITPTPIERGTFNRFYHAKSEYAFGWGNVEWSVHLIRLLTSLFSLASIILMYKTAQKIFDKKSHLPLAICLFSGFHPKFIHRSASIVNIPLLLLAFSLFFYFSLNHKPSKKTAFLLGLSSGLALITKITGLNLALFFFAHLLFFVKNWHQRFANMLSFVFGVTLVSGPLLVRNYVLYQDPLALNQAFRLAADLHSSQVIPLFGSTINYWFAIVEGTFITWWDGFGWENLIAGWPVHYALAALSLLSLGGFFRFLGTLRPSQFKRQLLFLVLTLGVFTLNFLSVNTQFFTPQGKDFFPMMLPLSVVIILGVSHWWSTLKLPKFKLRPVNLALVLFGLNVLVLLLLISPLTFGDRNISPADYYRRLQSDPIKQLWRQITTDK